VAEALTRKLAAGAAVTQKASQLKPLPRHAATTATGTQSKDHA
jgi:hypothetical protein